MRTASTSNSETYEQLIKTLVALCKGETDQVAIMATVSCEIFNTFQDFHWVGFYRKVDDRTLKIGPYQGGHGCLTISFDRGICGKCARENKIQNVPDVKKVDDHIACSSTTHSEIVIPITDIQGRLIAVLDIDSDLPDAFDETDEKYLPQVNRFFQ